MSKGVTPVLATVLLLFIAVAAVGSAAVFLESTLEEVQEGAESELEREEMVRASSLRIVGGFNDTDGYMNVEVRNSGTVSLDISDGGEPVWSLFVDDIPQEQWSSEISESQISPNELINLNTTSIYPTEGESKEVLISAPYETSARYICHNNDGFNRC